jgi:hypothetical protein
MTHEHCCLHHHRAGLYLALPAFTGSILILSWDMSLHLLRMGHEFSTSARATPMSRFLKQSGYTYLRSQN